MIANVWIQGLAKLKMGHWLRAHETLEHVLSQAPFVSSMRAIYYGHPVQGLAQYLYLLGSQQIFFQ